MLSKWNSIDIFKLWKKQLFLLCCCKSSICRWFHQLSTELRAMLLLLFVYLFIFCAFFSLLCFWIFILISEILLVHQVDRLIDEVCNMFKCTYLIWTINKFIQNMQSPFFVSFCDAIPVMGFFFLQIISDSVCFFLHTLHTFVTFFVIIIFGCMNQQVMWSWCYKFTHIVFPMSRVWEKVGYFDLDSSYYRECICIACVYGEQFKNYSILYEKQNLQILICNLAEKIKLLELKTTCFLFVQINKNWCFQRT